MFKRLITAAIVFGFCYSQDDFECRQFSSRVSDLSDPVCYAPKCMNLISKHIKEELNAAFHYLYMAAYFDQYSVQRPGLAKMLYESANEERQHAILMLDYLNSRGIFFDEPYSFEKHMITLENPMTYKKTLKEALNMEIKVTTAIHSIIKTCEVDFRAADVFTDPIMAEQHSGVRKLQGLIKTFEEMQLGYYLESEMALNEYIFDQKLLSGQI